MTDTATRGGARPRPDYTPKIVDEIPDDVTLPRTGPRIDPEFWEGIELAVSHPGANVQLGEWYSENGAHTQRKRIEKGDIKVPAGDWVFPVRRVDSGEVNEKTGKTKRWSRLYGIYQGPVSAA